MKLILLGCPGSGKGTVSQQLVRDYQLLHFSPGVILREEAGKLTKLGKEIKSYIDKGNLVPDNYVIRIIKSEIKNKDNFILDGFPRTIKQAKAMEGVSIDAVIFLTVPEKVVIERLSGRRVCQQGHNYHIKYIPSMKKGVCDLDGSKLMQRKDDDSRSIKERFTVYNSKTRPLVQYYKKKGILQTINGDQSPDMVYKDVRGIIENL